MYFNVTTSIYVLVCQVGLPFGLLNNIWWTLQIVMFLIMLFLSCDRPKFTHRVSSFKQLLTPPAVAVIQSGGQPFWFSVRLKRMSASLTTHRILFPHIVFQKISTITVFQDKVLLLVSFVFLQEDITLHVWPCSFANSFVNLQVFWHWHSKAYFEDYFLILIKFWTLPQNYDNTFILKHRTQRNIHMPTNLL